MSCPTVAGRICCPRCIGKKTCIRTCRPHSRLLAPLAVLYVQTVPLRTSSPHFIVPGSGTSFHNDTLIARSEKPHNVCVTSDSAPDSLRQQRHNGSQSPQPNRSASPVHLKRHRIPPIRIVVWKTSISIDRTIANSRRGWELCCILAAFT